MNSPEMVGISLHQNGHFIWLVVEPTPLKNMSGVSWDDDIPNIRKNKSHVPNHQPVHVNHC
jgi:hypothetical protein